MHFAKLLILMAMLVSTSFSALAANGKTTFGVGMVISGVSNNSAKAHFTCNAAKNKIRMAGFNRLEALSCKGAMYSFFAMANGQNIIVKISSTTGQIIHIASN